MTNGTPLKRIKFHARGRFGRKQRRHAHLNVTLAEIDFEQRIASARNKRQKDKWEKYEALAHAIKLKAEEEQAELDELQAMAPKGSDKD